MQLERLLEAVSGRQIADTRARLPEGYDALFEAGSRGTMNVEQE